MSETNILNPNPPEFEPFLYAPVGEDRNGSVVTMLSALARLGLDPWTEAAELAILGRDAARNRLGLLLSRLKDVPSLGRDHGSVARKLSLLLPEHTPLRGLKGTASSVADGGLGSKPVLWTILAIVFVLFQMLMIFGTGSGE